MSTQQDQAGGNGGGGRRGGKKKGRRAAAAAADEDDENSTGNVVTSSPSLETSAPSSTTTTTTTTSSLSTGGVEEALRESASKIIQQTNQGRSISIPQQKGASEGTITPFNTPVNPNIVAAAVAANKKGGAGAASGGGGAAGGAPASGGGGGAGGRRNAKNRNFNAEEAADDQDDGEEPIRVEDGLIRLTQDVKAKLGQLAIDDFLSKLPANVLKRVHAVQGIQGEINELHQRFLDEVKALERKYESLYAPHYERRKQLVAGDREPTEEEQKRGEVEVEKDKLPFQGEEKEKEEGDEENEEHAPVEDSKEPGIPGFWLRALQQHELFEQNIQERDEDALKSLIDVSCESFDRSETEKGFSLHFRFAPNPFFKNDLLTKTYYLVEEEELMLDRAEGSQIDWKEGQNLTVKTVRKRQKHRGGKNVRTVTKQVPCDSFFNFFSPPRMEDLDNADEVQQANIEELLEADFELGQTLKETIIPRAVDFFTGKANTFGEMDDDDFDEEDFDEDRFEGENDDDDNDDDDDAPPARGPAKRGGRGNARAGFMPMASDAAAPGEQPECKQQ